MTRYCLGYAITRVSDEGFVGFGNAWYDLLDGTPHDKPSLEELSAQLTSDLHANDSVPPSRHVTVMSWSAVA